MAADLKPPCPSTQELSDFALGKLADEACDSLAEHVEHCPPCQETLANLEQASDTLLKDVRAQAAAPPVEDSPECRQAVANIQALAPQFARLQLGGSAPDSPSQPTVDTQVAGAPVAVSQPSPAAVEGRVWGEYTLLERLGAGGMGEVFKARHRRMNRIVAIKVLPTAAMRSPEAVKRFQREVEAAARLSHPNIVAAYDAGEQDGVHYLVMEYVPGRDLSSLLRERGPLAPEEAVGYILQAARGLAYAHAKGVVHRDIKPANLLLDDEGTVKVLDMGLARFDDGAGAVLTAVQEGLTQSGQVMGTVDYMAPEQAFDIRRADGRSDIYSLGCTLYFLLTGRPPYGGETVMQRLLAHRDMPIPRIRDVRDDVPDTVDAAFAKMLTKKPENRYQSMSEVIAALSILQGARASVNSASRRSPWTYWGIAAGVASLLLGIVVIVKNRDGEELVRVVVPDGDSASVSTATDKPALRAMLKSHATSSATPPVAKAPFDTKQARAHQVAWAAHLGTTVESTNSIGVKLVLIPPGEFTMGSTPEEIAAVLPLTVPSTNIPSLSEVLQSEAPAHHVGITRPFLCSATEITIGQFRQFVEAVGYVTDAEKKPHNPDQNLDWRSPGHAVLEESAATFINWNEAAAFCNWLSEQEKLDPSYDLRRQNSWNALPGNGYRLPTEAQWEYACRAGTTTLYCSGDDVQGLRDFARFDDETSKLKTVVATRIPNAFGLYDMHANVFEWCQDWYDLQYYAISPPLDPEGPTFGTTRVARGGHWNIRSAYACVCVRSAGRNSSHPSIASYYYGFRIVRPL